MRPQEAKLKPVPLRCRVRICLALGLWIAAAALFLPIRSHDFILFDDPEYVSQNFLLEEGLTAAGLRSTFTTAYYYNWHPLTTISYAIDYQLHGRVAGGYLITNLLLHATATLLLFLALERLTGALGRSVFVAAVFAIHPLHVESVAWVSERKDVLSGVFFAALLWVYAAEADRAPTRGRRLGVFCLLTLGLLAKPMLVTVPFVLLLLDFWPLGRIPTSGLRPVLRALGPCVVEKLPLFLLAAASGAVTYAVQATSGAVQSLDQLPLANRLLNVPISYLGYLERSFWPRGLAFFYPMILSELSLDRALLATAALAVLTAGAFVLRRSAPYLLTGWLWFLGMLLPVIGFVQVGSQSMADRYTYLPLIGLAIGVAWGALDLVGARHAPRIVLGSIAAAALTGLAVVSAHQIDSWRDTESIAAQALAVTHSNATAHFVLARALLEQGRKEEARPQLEAAIAFQPKRAEYRGLLGNLLESEGAPEQAVDAYYDALRLAPTLVGVRARLGQVLLGLGRPEEALAVLEKASANSRQSGGPEIHLLMGRGLESRGDLAGAAAQYEVELDQWPTFPQAHANLGLVLTKQNRLPEAESHLRRARALGLDAPELNVALGDTLQRQGRMAEAADEFRAAVRLRPDWAVPANNLAWILATEHDPALRRPEEAVTLAEGAVRGTRRDNPSILDTLAVAYAAAGRRADALVTAREALAVARAQQRNDLISILADRVRSYEGKDTAPSP